MGTHQLAPGVVLGRYELLLPIASGGMATVWVARSKGTRGFSKTVAVKTILPNLSDDPTFEQMFLDEASIASKIQHHNVAQIIDLGEQDEILYLAMEWVDGESLSTLSKFARKDGNEIPLRVGLKILAQACAGIHAAHELRDDDDRHLMLVHRDVSPQNILITSSGVVKIVDFGVAKALGRTGETSAGQLKGKVPFMSPEQAKGGQVDRRTDIFALGIILYRVATGVHPFLDDTDIKTMRNIISRPPMPPRVKNPSIPVELERVILKALQKDPQRRHATAAELEGEIEAALTGLGGPVPLEEVATFVRASLGERDRKRRAAIRDAALKMDETSASTDPNHSAPSHLPLPVESISGVMLTKTQTPPGSETGADITRAMHVEREPTNDPVTQASGRVSQTGQGPSARPLEARQRHLSEPAIASSPTLAAVASAPEPITSSTAPSRRIKAIAIGLAAVLGIAAGVLLVGKLARPAADEAATAAAPAAAAAEPAASAESAKSDPSAAAVDAAGNATDAARAGETLDVADLPDQDPVKGKARNFHGAPAKAVTAQPTSAPGPTAVAVVTAPTAPPTATSKPATSKPAAPTMPTVQDPGF